LEASVHELHGLVIPQTGGKKLSFISRGERKSFSGGMYVSSAGLADAVEVSEYFETESYKSLST